MNGHYLCLLFLMNLTAALLVKSETIIEVDENGDEYEVKRFNIPARRLTATRSQCVEIRRKRSAQLQPSALYFDSGSNDEIESTNDDDSELTKGDDGSAMIFYSPPVISSAAIQQENADKEDDANGMNDDLHKHQLEEIGVKNNTKTKENEQDIQLPQLPILGQSQSDSMSGIKDKANVDGILVMQSQKPPKVNAQTHAVFELIPIEEVITKNDGAVENAFDFAVWPAGDNISNDVLNEDEQIPLRVQQLNKNKKQDKKHKKPKRKTKPSGHQNQNKKKRLMTVQEETSTANKNRRPNSNKIKITSNSFSNNRHRYYGYNGGNKNRKNAQEQIFIRPYTYKIEGDDYDYSDDYDYRYGNGGINCIIIHKDSPTPTTERPFWKLWGRSAEGARHASNQFGKRKRANLRFVA